MVEPLELLVVHNAMFSELVMHAWPDEQQYWLLAPQAVPSQLHRAKSSLKLKPACSEGCG